MVEDLGSYLQIAEKLNLLLKDGLETSQEITKLIIKFLHSGTPITPESLAPVLDYPPIILI